MNQRDCEGIAKIIRQRKEVLRKCDDLKSIDMRLELTRVSELLADYFESEHKQLILPMCLFNREQFLKDCGVK